MPPAHFKAGVTMRSEDLVVKRKRKEVASSSREEGSKDHNSHWHDHHDQNYNLYYKSMAVAGVHVHRENTLQFRVPASTIASLKRTAQCGAFAWKR